MAYNSRLSQQFRSTQEQQNRGKKKEDDGDAFMRLPDKEIAGCISDIGIPFTVADLVKPNANQIQMVFEWFAELLMNTTRETIEPSMRAAVEDVCGDFESIVPPDSRNLIGFFASLRRLMAECGIVDFSFSDLTRPTHDRLAKIFSYVINFVRFRESQTATIDQHFNKSEQTKARIDNLYHENRELEEQLEEIKRSQKAMDSQVKEKIRQNDEMKTKLLELRRNQERVAETLEQLKAEKARRQALFEEVTERHHRTRQESEKLKPYVLQSADALQSALAELQENLYRDKAHIDSLERRARALQTSSDTFNVVSHDVQRCVKLLEEIAVELQTEEEEEARAARNSEAVLDRTNSVREVMQTESLLQRQLTRWQERTEVLRKNSREKAEAARERMEELRHVQKELREERGEKGKEMERRRVRIEQTEKKMADLKENIEAEIQSSHDEYLKMESHIKLYITEMEKSL